MLSAWKRAAARVIKHRAPNGALRRIRACRDLRAVGFRYKAPSAKQCIKTDSSPRSCRTDPCHKAPSAKRCIKTGEPGRGECRVVSFVIKHRAPNGALRHQRLSTHNCIRGCHKAPSAKRCIKTRTRRACCRAPRMRHKAPSAKRCIKTLYPECKE